MCASNKQAPLGCKTGDRSRKPPRHNQLSFFPVELFEEKEKVVTLPIETDGLDSSSQPRPTSAGENAGDRPGRGVGADIDPAHLSEWTDGSGIDPEIAKLNVETRQNKKIIARQLGWEAWKYEFGGWWCGGIDLTTGEKSKLGQFKPDQPVELSEGKGAKYLTSKKGYDAIALAMLDESYWQKVIEDETQLVVITEGAKKAGALLTCGYATLALCGVEMAHLKNGHPVRNLKALVRTGRHFVICFDSDERPETAKNVRAAIERLAKSLMQHQCTVSVAGWDSGLGKGLDDVLVAHGKDKVVEVIGNAIPLKKWRQLSKSKETGNTESHEAVVSRKETDRCLYKREYESVAAALKDRLRYNDLTGKVELNSEVIDLDFAQHILGVEYNLDIAPIKAAQMIVAISKQKSYHPVADYLDAVSKCYGNDTTLMAEPSKRYLGTTDEIYDVYLRKTLIAAVARALNPKPTKVDTVLILQGGQGIGKSTFFKVLASSDFFDDSMGEYSDKDEVMKLHLAWFTEWAELDSVFGRKEISRIKGFISRTTDRIREPYARTVSEKVRRGIIVGSINPQTFLSDPTGERRFLVIPVRKEIRCDLLEQERDRLWAAAVALYKQGMEADSNIPPWVLTRIEAAMSASNNEKFEADHPWTEFVEGYCLNLQSVTVKELLGKIKPNIGDQTRADSMKVAEILQKLDFVPKRVYENGATIRRHYRITPDTSPESAREGVRGCKHYSERDSKISDASDTKNCTEKKVYNYEEDEWVVAPRPPATTHSFSIDINNSLDGNRYLGCPDADRARQTPSDTSRTLPNEGGQNGHVKIEPSIEIDSFVYDLDSQYRDVRTVMAVTPDGRYHLDNGQIRSRDRLEVWNG